jgi:hypothetical protein
MHTRAYSTIYAEYLVYALAVAVIVGMGTLFYVVDSPIKFASWFS